jgi:hypothetical protein
MLEVRRYAFDLSRSKTKSFRVPRPRGHHSCKLRCDLARFVLRQFEIRRDLSAHIIYELLHVEGCYPGRQRSSRRRIFGPAMDDRQSDVLLCSHGSAQRF